MGARAARISQVVRGYDHMLYAIEHDGQIQVWREALKEAASDNPEWYGIPSWILRPNSHYVFSLTDNWAMSGKPVDRGIEQVLNHLRAKDAWRFQDFGAGMREARESQARDYARQKKNNIRALATDMRRDFAKAVQDL